MANTAKMVTAKQAASHVKIGDKGIRRYIRNGKLKAHKIDGNWLIDEADLNAFVIWLNNKPATTTKSGTDHLVCPVCEKATTTLPADKYGTVITAPCKHTFVYRAKHVEKREPVAPAKAKKPATRKPAKTTVPTEPVTE